MYYKTISILLLLIAGFNVSAIVTVGNNLNGCTFTTLAEAIDDAQINNGDTDIFVTNEFTQGYSGTITKSLVIKGGYDSCSDAFNDVPGTSKTNWKNALPNTSVIRIFNSIDLDQNLHTILHNFNIYGGNSDTEAGGINIKSDSKRLSLVEITNTKIFNNYGNLGGGIFSDGNGVEVYLYNTTIHDNSSATNGGGVNCINNAEITVSQESSINYNDSTINGGGFSLDECTLVFFSGAIYSPENWQNGIFKNSASQNGGGLYANNSEIEIYGNHIVPVWISQNTSSGLGFSGGGIYANNTIFQIRNGQITSNTSNNLGGGIVLKDSVFNMRRINERCWGDNSHCSSFSGNVSLGKNQGFSYAGAGYIKNSTVKITRTAIENNSSDFSSVFAIFDDSDVLLESNLITNNSDNEQQVSRHLFGVVNEAEGTNLKINFSYNTLTQNNTENIFHTTSSENSPIELNIGNSIIWQADSFIVDRQGYPSIVSIDCAMLNYNSDENISLYNLGFVSQLNPKFVNPAAQNFHLNDNSPAIDFCDNTFLPAGFDLNSNNRGIDRVATQNFHGIYDLGAYEHPQLDDIIFINNFD